MVLIMKFFANLKKLNKLGASMVEYAIVLACIASIGVTVTSPNLTNTLDSLFSNVTKILALNDEASKPASKYNIGDDAIFIYNTIIHVVTSFLLKVETDGY